MHARAGDAIRQLRLGRLYADLHVIETGGDEPVEQRVVEKRALRDQVGVEAAGARRASTTPSAASGTSVGSPPDTWICRTPKSAASPTTRCHDADVELVAVGAEVQRIIAVRTLQVAAIR